MKKKWKIALVVIVVLVVAAGGFIKWKEDERVLSNARFWGSRTELKEWDAHALQSEVGTLEKCRTELTSVWFATGSEKDELRSKLTARENQVNTALAKRMEQLRSGH